MNDKDAIEQFEHFQQIVKAIRRYRAENKIPAKVKLPVVIRLNHKYKEVITMRESLIALANLDPNKCIIFVGAENDG